MLLQVDFEAPEALCRPPGTLRPLHKQPFAVAVQVDQWTARCFCASWIVSVAQRADW